MVEVPSAIVVRPLQHAAGREFSLLAFARSARRGLARIRGSRREHSFAVSRGPLPRKTIGARDAARTGSETTHEAMHGAAPEVCPVAEWMGYRTRLLAPVLDRLRVSTIRLRTRNLRGLPMRATIGRLRGSAAILAAGTKSSQPARPRGHKREGDAKLGSWLFEDCSMVIEAGFDIAFECPAPTPMLLQLSIHPSRDADLLTPERIASDPRSADARLSRSFRQPGHPR